MPEASKAPPGRWQLGRLVLISRSRFLDRAPPNKGRQYLHHGLIVGSGVLRNTFKGIDSPKADVQLFGVRKLLNRTRKPLRRLPLAVGV